MTPSSEARAASDETTETRNTTMSYFYWITGLGFAILLAATIETVVSRRDE